MTTDSVIRILRAGGNLTLDCQGKTTDSLLRIIKVAIEENKKISLINLKGKSSDNLIRIVKAGGDNVSISI